MSKAKAPAAVDKPSWAPKAEAEAPLPAVVEGAEAEAVIPEAVSPAEPKAPSEMTTVTCDKAFRCRLTHQAEHHISAGVQEMDPDLAEKLANHWYAKAHGFRIYKK